MKKELMIFFGIFLFLALAMHFKQWTTHPIDHILALSSAGAYGLGSFHPLIITSVIYLIVLLFRGIAKLFTRKK